MRKLFVGVLLIGGWIGLSAQSDGVDAFFERFAAEWVRNAPTLATSTRYFSGDEQQRLERDLTPVSLAYQQQRAERARNGLAQLQRFDRSAMSPLQQLSADVFAAQTRDIVDGAAFVDYTYPFEQFRGANINIVDALTVQQPLSNRTDVRNLIARLNLVPTRIQEAIAEARRQEAKGIVPPRFILRATIDQMRQFTAAAPGRNPIVANLATRLDTMTDVPAAERTALLEEATHAVETQVYPAWSAAVGTLESQLPRATDDAGLWRFRDGERVYAYQLRLNTTTNLTADEIHRIGLREVARIEAEMEVILRRLGRTEGALNARIDALKREQAYPLTDEGRAQIMNDISQILADAQARSRTLFDLTPKAPVDAEAYPRFREESAAGQYTAPSPDGSRPGTFRIPLRASRMTKFGLRTLVYHETVPGHHYQIALMREDQSLPRFRQLGIFGGLPVMVEGWGLYAERLAVDSGWYADDPVGQLGQLDGELFRARRLVVDTGLHAKHWTRQQAIDYGIEPSEVDRYVVYPGQACAYMLGQLKLIELRDKASKALGSRSSLKDFHAAIQRTGAVPLDLLEQQVDLYIASKQ